MKMRKLMAVLLAVVVAISAMAVSAFATDYDTYTIPLYDVTNLYGYTATYTIEVPAYALFGYAQSGDTVTLYLPSKLDTIVGGTLAIDYALTVNGATVELKGNDDYVGTDTAELYEQEVIIGTFSRDYISDDVPAMVPQSTVVATSTSVTITATVDYSYDAAPTSALDEDGYYTYYYSYSNASTSYSTVTTTRTANYATSNVLDTNPVGTTYSTYSGIIMTYNDNTGESYDIYVQNVSCSVSTETDESYNYITIVSDARVAGSGSEVLTWDHTLSNRATILNAASTDGSTAKVVVTLGSSKSWLTPINGIAVYTLQAYSEDATYGSSSSANSNLWYSTGTSALYSSAASTCLLNGSASELVFEVPLSLLYNGTYGLYNGYFTVTMASMDTSNSSYCYYNETNYWSSYSLTASDVYLEISIPVDDDTVVENDAPVEDTNTETEDDELEVDDTDDTTTEPETNPTTGIVLALVPMAVAAAAAVASKRK